MIRTLLSHFFQLKLIKTPSSRFINLNRPKPDISEIIDPGSFPVCLGLQFLFDLDLHAAVGITKLCLAFIVRGAFI